MSWKKGRRKSRQNSASRKPAKLSDIIVSATLKKVKKLPFQFYSTESNMLPLKSKETKARELKQHCSWETPESAWCLPNRLFYCAPVSPTPVQIIGAVEARVTCVFLTIFTWVRDKHRHAVGNSWILLLIQLVWLLFSCTFWGSMAVDLERILNAYSNRVGGLLLRG